MCQGFGRVALIQVNGPVGTAARDRSSRLADLCLVAATRGRHTVGMPERHYHTLAKQYALMSERATTPLLKEGYRKLAEGYAALAQAHSRANAIEPSISARQRYKQAADTKPRRQI
jgi:hypothetical protein